MRSPDLDVLDEANPQVLSQAVSGAVADQLTQMMVDVVESGTGTNVQIPNVTVAGKTGTANSSVSRSPYAWMVTFAPSGQPAGRGCRAGRADRHQPRRHHWQRARRADIAKAVMEAVINP